MSLPIVLDKIVKYDLCIGCGLCTYICPTYALEMKWSDYGFLVPELSGECDLNGNCISVCPFNPNPEADVKTENEIAGMFLSEANEYHPKIGKFVSIYTGHSDEFRLTSSSGGVATYVFAELIDKGIVEHVFSVKESKVKGVFYEYSVSSTRKELLNASKTKYFPVTLETVLSKVWDLKGKVAVVGVACFIKAIRLAQFKEPALKEKIPILIGIICGGVKSRFFTEYLAGKVNVAIDNIEKPHFRVKNLESSASDYSFSCINKKDEKYHSIKMQTVGDMWGTGLFKNNACDFCDDVTTELADISLGDAWIEPFSKDGAGTNVIITRSQITDNLIKNGIESGKLIVKSMSIDKFLASQQGSFNHRHLGLSFRMRQAKNKKVIVPPKRFDNEKVSVYFKVVQVLRQKTRKKSLDLWAKYANTHVFDSKMKKYLNQLYFATLIYHYIKEIKKKFNCVK